MALKRTFCPLHRTQGPRRFGARHGERNFSPNILVTSIGRRRMLVAEEKIDRKPQQCRCQCSWCDTTKPQPHHNLLSAPPDTGQFCSAAPLLFDRIDDNFFVPNTAPVRCDFYCSYSYAAHFSIVFFLAFAIFFSPTSNGGGFFRPQ